MAPREWRVSGLDAQTGNRTAETVTADSAAEAEQQAASGGLITPKARRKVTLGSGRGIRASRKETSKALRTIATCLSADLDPYTAVRLARQGLKRQSSGASRVFADVERRVRDGTPLSQAMAAHPKAFPEAIVVAVEAGTTSGNLSAALGLLADTEEAASGMRTQMLQSLTYPALLLLMAVGTLVMALETMIPTMTSNIEQLGVELPRTTAMTVDGYEFVLRNWWKFVAGAAVGVFVFARVMRLPRVRAVRSRLMWHVPVISSVIRNTSEGVFCRMTGAMLTADMPPDRAFAVASRAAKSVYYAGVTDKIVQLMRTRGLPPDRAIEENTPPLGRMLSSLAKQTKKGLADAGEPWTRYGGQLLDDAEHAANTLDSALQPVIYGMLGAVFLGLMIVVYGPTFAMTQAV